MTNFHPDHNKCDQIVKLIDAVLEPFDWNEPNSDQTCDLCRHTGTTSTRIAHGYLHDAPRGTAQILCNDCGTILS